jgi:hypothetical protein
MCYRGGQARADDRKFAGFESVEGGVRGILIVSLQEGSAILAV